MLILNLYNMKCEKCQTEVTLDNKCCEDEHCCKDSCDCAAEDVNCASGCGECDCGSEK